MHLQYHILPLEYHAKHIINPYSFSFPFPESYSHCLLLPIMQIKSVLSPRRCCAELPFQQQRDVPRDKFQQPQSHKDSHNSIIQILFSTKLLQPQSIINSKFKFCETHSALSFLIHSNSSSEHCRSLQLLADCSSATTAVACIPFILFYYTMGV